MAIISANTVTSVYCRTTPLAKSDMIVDTTVQSEVSKSLKKPDMLGPNRSDVESSREVG